MPAPVVQKCRMLLACCALWLCLGSVAVRAEDGGLSVELNKVEEVGGDCVASLVFHNDLGATLDRFNLDLILFDREGVILRRLVIDLAPLRNGKTRVAQFRLHDESCDELGHVLINDIPVCRAEAGGEIDCLLGLSVNSRSDIELIK